MEALSGEPIIDLGTAEASWQRSGFLAALPVSSVDALLSGCGRVVVVSPHPDDEVLGCGGLLSHCARQQRPVLIVSVSDGEHCYPGNEDWPPSRVRQARRQELRSALVALGLHDVSPIRLGIADGQVAAHQDQLARLLAKHVLRDDAVFVPWRRDGHPDHEAVARAAFLVSAAAGARLVEFPVWGWHWAAADGDAFHGLGMSRVALDATAHEAKRRAIACFTSQVSTSDPSIPSPVLPAHVLQRFLRSYEVFIHD